MDGGGKQNKKKNNPDFNFFDNARETKSPSVPLRNAVSGFWGSNSQKR